jgi:AcrR family transcriptional regulator
LPAGEKLAVARHSVEFSLADVAAQARVSGSTVAIFFTNSGQLLVECALDLARQEILSQYLDPHPPTAGPSTSAFAQHFFRHREFYTVMHESPLSSALNSAFDELFVYFNALNVRGAVGPSLTSAQVDKIAGEITSAARETVHTWLFDETAIPTQEGLYLMLESIMLSRFAARKPADPAH